MQTNLWYPVAFFSKLLDVHKRNYKIYDKELLAVIRGLEEYRHHLEGHPHKIEIWPDHQNLIFFRAAQKLTRRQARWALFMTCFDFALYHKPGKTMQAEDPLSRRADHEMGTDLDNMNQVLLKPEFFTINALDVMETLDSTELFMEDQTWLDYLWDFETRGINLDLPSDTD